MINLKFADITFSEMGKSLEEICKMLAGKIIENYSNQNNQFLEIQSRAFGMVTNFINEKRKKMENRKERFYRTENFIDKSMAQLDKLLEDVSIKDALEYYSDEDKRLENLLVPS